MFTKDGDILIMRSVNRISDWIIEYLYQRLSSIWDIEKYINKNVDLWDDSVLPMRNSCTDKHLYSLQTFLSESLDAFEIRLLEFCP